MIGRIAVSSASPSTAAVVIEQAAQIATSATADRSSARSPTFSLNCAHQWVRSSVRSSGPSRLFAASSWSGELLPAAATVNSPTRRRSAFRLARGTTRVTIASPIRRAAAKRTPSRARVETQNDLGLARCSSAGGAAESEVAECGASRHAVHADAHLDVRAEGRLRAVVDDIAAGQGVCQAGEDFPESRGVGRHEPAVPFAGEQLASGIERRVAHADCVQRDVRRARPPRPRPTRCGRCRGRHRRTRGSRRPSRGEPPAAARGRVRARHRSACRGPPPGCSSAPVDRPPIGRQGQLTVGV